MEYFYINIKYFQKPKEKCGQLFQVALRMSSTKVMKGVHANLNGYGYN
jgi:hypothetical protein